MHFMVAVVEIVYVSIKSYQIVGFMLLVLIMYLTAFKTMEFLFVAVFYKIIVLS